MKALTGRMLGDIFPPGVYRVGDDGLRLSGDGRLQFDAAIATPDPAMRPPQAGDIMAVMSDGTLRTIFQSNANDNFLFVTNRCQNRCRFCSQPPSTYDDSWLVEEALAAIPLIPSTTTSLGITGGEPTLIGQGLLRILASIKHHLPETRVHLLSNGRLFAWLGLAQALENIGIKDLVVAIPLHSDIADHHDALAGSSGAWGETVRGCLHLARYGIPVEIRVVMARNNYQRLEDIALWIGRNLPFATHVAWMGQEVTGYALANEGQTWIDPHLFTSYLERATRIMQFCGIRCSIYNVPHCQLPPVLWETATSSISSWKRLFPIDCQDCGLRPRCCGIFSTGTRFTVSPITTQKESDLSTP